MTRSNLCDYSGAYILASGIITITGAGDDDATKRADERNKGVTFKKCLLFIECISSINNTQINYAKDIDVVMPIYNLIEYSDNYSKTSESLLQYSKDDPNVNITESESLKSKIKITGNAPGDDNKKNVEIAVPFKFLSNFRRTLEILINCEMFLNFTWSEKCVTSSAVGKTELKITDTKLYVPVVTLSTADNVKILKQLESGFKRTINWNKYQPELKTFLRSKYLNYLIDPSFQGVSRLFVLLFENETDREVHTKHYLPNTEIKYHNVIIDGRRFFDQPIQNDLKTYNNIRNIATGQGGDYKTGSLLDYNYSKEHYKLIAIDISKQQKRDADPKAIQQINFSGNLKKDALIFFITDEAKETILDFSKGAVKAL